MSLYFLSGSDKDVLVMHLSKHACDTPKACEKTLKKYTGMLFYTVFPALGVTYEYSGRAEKGVSIFARFQYVGPTVPESM